MQLQSWCDLYPYYTHNNTHLMCSATVVVLRGASSIHIARSGGLHCAPNNTKSYTIRVVALRDMLCEQHPKKKKQKPKERADNNREKRITYIQRICGTIVRLRGRMVFASN